jgi:hypothetical protein
MHSQVRRRTCVLAVGYSNHHKLLRDAQVRKVIADANPQDIKDMVQAANVPPALLMHTPTECLPARIM